MTRNCRTDVRELDKWVTVAQRLDVSDRVHRPSTFSAFLAAGMKDCQDMTVVDAGCGAGLVSLAALSAGASHVVAQDYDAAALSDTARNVTRVLGPTGRARLTLWESDWRQLGPMCADLLAVNPPQRPAALLPDVPPDQRHLHDGGGADGLDGIRLVLSHTGATRVRTTAAAALHLETQRFPGWSTPQPITSADLPFDPAWRALIPDLRGRVDIWELVSDSASPRLPPDRRPCSPCSRSRT